MSVSSFLSKDQEHQRFHSPLSTVQRRENPPPALGELHEEATTHWVTTTLRAQEGSRARRGAVSPVGPSSDWGSI